MDGFLRSMTSGQEKLFPLRSKKFFTQENQNTKIFWYLKGNRSNFIVIGSTIWHVRFIERLYHTLVITFPDYSFNEYWFEVMHLQEYNQPLQLTKKRKTFRDRVSVVNTVYLHPGFVIQPLIINIVDLKMHKWITLLDMNELVPHEGWGHQCLYICINLLEEFWGMLIPVLSNFPILGYRNIWSTYM